MRVRKRLLVQKFYADRGPHLAAMIAYFALLALVPLIFLALALLGLAGKADASSFLVTELKRAFPGSSISGIVDFVNAVGENAAALGIVGGAFLLWSAMSLFSVLESAFNIVYGRPNRSFFRGKALAVLLMVGSLGALFVSLVVGSLGFDVLRHFTPGFAENQYVAYASTVIVSTLGIFLFLWTTYYVLTNVEHAPRDVLPGAIVATVLLEGSFQLLPAYLRILDLNVAVRAFSTTGFLVVWLYVMANVIVLGAEVNWWQTQRREARIAEEAPGLA